MEFGQTIAISYTSAKWLDSGDIQLRRLEPPAIWNEPKKLVVPVLQEGFAIITCVVCYSIQFWESRSSTSKISWKVAGGFSLHVLRVQLFFVEIPPRASESQCSTVCRRVLQTLRPKERHPCWSQVSESQWLERVGFTVSWTSVWNIQKCIFDRYNQQQRKHITLYIYTCIQYTFIFRIIGKIFHLWYSAVWWSYIPRIIGITKSPII